MMFLLVPLILIVAFVMIKRNNVMARKELWATPSDEGGAILRIGSKAMGCTDAIEAAQLARQMGCADYDILDMNGTLFYSIRGGSLLVI